MRPFKNLGYRLMALGIALLLWGVANSTSSVERGFDLPVVLIGVPETAVVVGQSSDTVNVRVRGSRAGLRAFSGGEIEYRVDLTGAKPGVTSREVDLGALTLPRGAQIVSRSPSSIDFTMERRSTKAVRIRADLDGEPAEGFKLAGIEVEPPQVRITGARSEVLRLSEVLTETIDVTGAEALLEKTVRPSLGGRHLWLDGEQEITVRVRVESLAPPEEPSEETG